MGYTGLAVLGVSALAVPRVSFPPDTGTWAPLALPASSVSAVVGTPHGVLAAHGDRLTRVGPDGATTGLDVPAPVRSVAVDGAEVYAGTTDGIVLLPLDGGDSRAAGLDGLAVHALDVHDGVLYAGTDQGLHRRLADGTWSRLWPPPAAPAEPARPVTAVLAVPDAVVFVYDGAVLRWSGDAPADTVVDRTPAPVVSLSRGGRGGQLWAGLRGEPLLLKSEDGGRTWTPSGKGLGLSAVNDVLTDPVRPERVLVAGSGLADGTGNAGVERSTDAGRSWHTAQDRLSNTHVFDLESRVEPLRLAVSLPGVAGTGHLALPVRQHRTYAATNGGGIYSISPSTVATRTFVSLHPMFRIAEPLLLGLLALLCLVPAYTRLTRAGTRARGKAPDTH